PLTAIDYFSASGDHNFAVRAPGDFDFPSFHQHPYIAIGLIIHHRGDCSSAGTGARGGRFTHSPFPNTKFQYLSLEYANEDYVGSIRKLGMALYEFAYAAPIKGIEVVHEDATHWIAHLHCGYRKLFAGNWKFV